MGGGVERLSLHDVCPPWTLMGGKGGRGGGGLGEDGVGGEGGCGWGGKCVGRGEKEEKDSRKRMRSSGPWNLRATGPAAVARPPPPRCVSKI